MLALRTQAVLATVLIATGCGSNTALPVVAECRHAIGIEICNGLDDDCNGLADDATTVASSCPSELSCREGACCSDEEIRSPIVDKLDLLFVLDDSRSMSSEQEKLRRTLPDLVRGLVTGDVDGDGTRDPDVNPLKSVRVGVVTTDMGIQGIGLTPGTRAQVGCGRSSDGSEVDPEQANYGDDGVLRTRVNRTVDGEPVLHPTTGVQVSCDHAPQDGRTDTLTLATMPAYLTFDATPGLPPTAEAVSAYVDAVACFTAVGTDGCGFEQQLEATLKAVTPADREPFEGPFFVGRGDDPAVRGVGHAEDPRTNGPWFREDAALAVILVTDEDDCSARDPAVYDTNAGPPYQDDSVFKAGTRCERYPETLHSVQRYVRGLLATRANDRARLFFGAITGVPPELTDDVEDGEGVDNLEAILDAPAMQTTLAPRKFPCSRTSSGTYECFVDGCVCDTNHEFAIPDGEVAPACTFDPGTPSDPDDDESATPGRRIVRVASALHDEGVRVVVQSICQPDFRDSIRVMLRDILRVMPPRIDGSCLERPQSRDPIGEVDCEVHTTLAFGDSCSAHPGMTFERMDGPREVCTVTQIAVTEATRATGAPPRVDSDGSPAHGFFYDDYTEAARVVCSGASRIGFTTGDALPPEAELRFTCCEPGRAP